MTLSKISFDRLTEQKLMIVDTITRKVGHRELLTKGKGDLLRSPLSVNTELILCY